MPLRIKFPSFSFMQLQIQADWSDHKSFCFVNHRTWKLYFEMSTSELELPTDKENSAP